MTTNKQMFKESLEIVPGGVHSPVRALKGIGTPPLFFKKGKGAFLTDVEGKEYIDFCMSFGPLILGHTPTPLKKALKEAIEIGTSFGACEPYSLELAKFIVKKIPFIEKIRFVNSGTEAVMTALRIARGYTSKEKIVKFNGCYHGHTDSMLIKAGSGLAGESETSSKGVPQSITNDTIVLELGDEKGLKELYKKEGKNIAAVIIEPLGANSGIISNSISFLKEIRKITKENNSLLIFDEVISGFRINIGGMACKTGIIPDLITYGKVIGGGLPVGAVAGASEIMDTLAPLGEVYQAGTLSANPLAMIGGLATLKELTDKTYKTLKENTVRITSILEKWFKEYNNGEFSHYKITQQESLFWISTLKDITSAKDFPEDFGKDFPQLFKTLIDKGVYLAPNPYEISFVSTAHDEKVAQELERRLGL